MGSEQDGRHLELGTMQVTPSAVPGGDVAGGTCAGMRIRRALDCPDSRPFKAPRVEPTARARRQLRFPQPSPANSHRGQQRRHAARRERVRLRGSAIRSLDRARATEGRTAVTWHSGCELVLSDP
jgi:hypothetical protein